MKVPLSQADQDRVRQAIAAAETRTSGEIVPFIVPRSSRYREVVWQAAVMMAVLVAAIAFGLMRFYEGWGFGWLFDGFGMALTLFVAGILGALLGAYVPAIKRWLAGENRMARRVHARAMRAFVEEEVFSTRERTGILLFVSMMEHRIEVLGDTGINQKVTADDWIDVVAHIRDGIRKNKLVDGLVEAIELCGALLERKDVEIRDDDSDELSNEVRFSDE